MSSSEPVAVVGMACIFPGSPDVSAYWRNILAANDCITDIPPARNREEEYAVLLQGDDISCRRGGFLPEEHRFSPVDYGIMPDVCRDIDPEQLLILETIDKALEDSGINPEEDDLSATETILGRGGYLGNYLQQVHMRVEVVPQILSILRGLHPGISDADLIRTGKELQSAFIHLNSDRIPFGIPNITTGRAANRFDFMGGNYTVDAACASALVAADNAIASLQSGRAERVVTGGVFLAGNPSFWWTFSRLGALSKKNSIRPFSKEADGMLVGEGLGILVLEPKSAAEKAGRRIYALLRGSATSSDGRGNAVLAPRSEGQLLCLKKAYETSGIDPRSVGLIEGHGTGTLAGDQVELSSITRFFAGDSGKIPVRALGSVKSMIGHLMPAAGAAAMIKTSLALYHRILPASLHADSPAPELAGSSLYLNDKTRPWVQSPRHPRRAGVNAFGFGGINAHIIMEENNAADDSFKDLQLEWPTELFLFSGQTEDELLLQIRNFSAELPETFSGNEFAGFSRRSCRKWQPGRAHNLSLVADTQNIATLLLEAEGALTENRPADLESHSNIFYTEKPMGREGKVVFIFPGNAFPGLGDDYTDRLAELSCYLPFFRKWFDMLDEKDSTERPYPFSSMLFSPPGLDQKTLVALKKELRQLTNSAAGVFMANSAGQDLMLRLGIQPDMVTGTSLGEWSALMAGGMIGFDDVAAMGTHLAGKDGVEITGGLGLAQCSMEQLAPVLESVDNGKFGRVSCALDLSPAQVVFGGDREAVQEVSRCIQEKGLWAEAFNMTPIHTPLCTPIARSQHEVIHRLQIKAADVPVYSGATGAPYPEDPDQARTLLADNTVLPVQMRSLFSRLHRDGARIFLQLGGGGKVLGPLRETLANKPFFATSLDMPNTHPTTQLQHVTGELIAHGLALNPDLLFQYRSDLLQEKKKPAAQQNKPETMLNMAVPKLHVTTPLQPPAMETTGQTQSPAQTGISLESILSRQLELSGRMLNLQQTDQAMDAQPFIRELARQQQTLFTEESSPAEPIPMPFVSRITDYSVGKRMVIEHTLNPEQDCFLLHHTFIPCPEHIKAAIDRFPTLPMAVTLEIMAEAALSFMPGMTILSLENIRNRRWIDLGRHRPLVQLRIVLEKQETELPHETRISCTISSDINPDLLHISGDIVLGSELSADTELPAENRTFSRTCRLNPETLYSHNRLYHGPSFQGIDRLLSWDENGISGILRVPAADDFFSTDTRGSLVLAPALIDVASQLIACWAWEQDDNNFWVVPVAVKQLKIFGDPPPPGTQVQASLSITGTDAKSLIFDMELAAAGTIYCRIQGWQDYRMGWTPHFTKVWQSAADIFLSKPLTVSGIPPCSLCRLHDRDLQGIDLEWVANLFLHESELLQFLSHGPARQKSWLLGRMAAKDAVRAELLRTTGISGIYPSQCIISNYDNGQPLVELIGLDREIADICVSISHKEHEAVAAAVMSEKAVGIGIDLEEIHNDLAILLQGDLFTEEEKLLLQSVPAEELSRQTGKLWCAKEAAAKAIGLENPFAASRYPLSQIPDSIDAQSLTICHRRKNGVQVCLDAQILEEGTTVIGVALLE